MAVRIIPVGLLRASLPAGQLDLEVEGKTAGEVLAELGIEADLVAMVLINGRQQPKETVLGAGDVVKLVPFAGGG